MRLVILALLLFVVAQQNPDQPFPNHEQPPDGWYCSHNDTRAAHKCACQRMDEDPLCEGTPKEEAVCKVYCHADHCHCPIMCAPEKGSH